MPASALKILIVDDHPVFRSGMVVMMRNLFDGATIFEAGDKAGLDRELECDEPFDLIVLDLLFPGFDASNDFSALRKRLALTPIATVSMVHDDKLIDQVMGAGANGFISKTAHPDDMSAALLSIMEGETIIVRATGPKTSTPATDDLSELTARQLDVLRFVARGLSNKEIAQELDISPFTVRIHVSAVLRTLGLPNRSAAASFAVSRGLHKASMHSAKQNAIVRAGLVYVIMECYARLFPGCLLYTSPSPRDS